MYHCLRVLLLLIPFTLLAQQNELDSLMKQDQVLEGEEKLSNLIRITRWYVVQNDSLSIDHGKKALDYANEIGSSEGKGKASFFVGVAYDDLQADSALKYYLQALKILEPIKHNWVGYCYTNIGRIYREKGWYPEALNLGIRALKHFEELQDSSQMAKEITNIGYSYDRTGEYKLALQYHQRALPIALEYNNDYIIALVYGRIGIAYDELKMYDSAHYYNYISADYYLRADDNNMVMATLSNIANTFMKQNRFSEAEEVLLNAIENNTSDYNKSFILINLGNVYQKTGKYQQADKVLDEAILLANEYKQVKYRSEAYYVKYEMYKAMGNLEKALDYFIRFNSLTDSILNEEKTQQLADMRVRYETDQKEKQILKEKAAKEELAKENALAEIKLYNRNKWIIGISSLTLVVIFFGLFWIQRTRRKTQAEKDAAIILEREKGLDAVIIAQENERKRIAKDLHDGIGQQLSGLKLGWQHLLAILKSQKPEEEQQLNKLTRILDDAAADVRTISHQMMPRVLSESGLIPALEDMLSKSLGTSDIPYEFETFQAEGRFDEKIETSLYRVAQELINNIIKHSGAEMVNIQLFTNKGFLILIVEDNGKGFESDQPGDGHGMLNIKSRINSIHGEVSYDPSPGSGTVATIRVPV